MREWSWGLLIWWNIMLPNSDHSTVLEWTCLVSSTSYSWNSLYRNLCLFWILSLLPFTHPLPYSHYCRLIFPPYPMDRSQKYSYVCSSTHIVFPASLCCHIGLGSYAVTACTGWVRGFCVFFISIVNCSSSRHCTPLQPRLGRGGVWGWEAFCLRTWLYYYDISNLIFP